MGDEEEGEYDEGEYYDEDDGEYYEEEEGEYEEGEYDEGEDEEAEAYRKTLSHRKHAHPGEDDDDDDEDEDEEDDDEDEDDENDYVMPVDTVVERKGPKSWMEAAEEVAKLVAELDTTGPVVLGANDPDDVIDPLTPGSAPLSSASASALRSKVRLDRDDFDPKEFLASMHTQTSFEQLNEARAALKARLATKTADIKALVAGNFPQFIKCKDTVDSMHDKMAPKKEVHHDGEDDDDEDDEDGEVEKPVGHAKSASVAVDELETAYKELENSAKGVFQVLLDRKKDAELRKFALALIERSKFLFKLPSQLESAVAAGDHEKVVHTYARAQALIADSQNAISQKILLQCDKIVNKFRNQLLEILQDPNASFQQHLQIIETLSKIGVDASLGDPLQYYISIHKKRIRQLLVSLGNSFRSLQSHQEESQKQLAFVKKLCDVIRTQLPLYYNLINHFCKPDTALEDTGKPFLKYGGKPTSKAQQKAQYLSVWVNNKTDPIHLRVTRETSMAAFVVQILDYLKRTGQHTAGVDYTLFIQFTQKTKDGIEVTKKPAPFNDKPYNLDKKWKRKADQQHKFVLSSEPADKSAAKSAPTQTIQMVQKVAPEFLQSVIQEILKEFSQQVFSLLTNEYALDDFRDKSYQQCLLELEGTLKVIQQAGIPTAFMGPLETIVAELKQQFVTRISEKLKAASSRLYHDEDWIIIDRTTMCTNLPTQYLTLVRDVHAITASFSASTFKQIICRAVVESMLCLVDCYHHLAFECDVEEGEEFQDTTPSDDKKLLTILANCVFTKNEIFPSVVKLFSLGSAESQPFAVLHQLEIIVSREFERVNIIHVCQLVRNGLLSSGLQWDSLPEPSEIQPFVLTALLEVVCLHAHVYMVIPNCITDIMRRVLKNMMLSYHDCVRCIEKINANGLIQLAANMSFICVVLACYRTDQTEATAKAILEWLELVAPSKISVTNKEKFITRLVDTQRQHTRALFACFSAQKQGP
ncbi:exocyst complex subunit 2 [Pelomyxa schiedti]|nr:exocyst complex subunit 2 [Pelomyxa schiedti]